MTDIHSQLLNLGVSPGDVVLMHSSMKALGTNITPREFLSGLMQVLTPGGTLLLPALTYESVTSDNPNFSITESKPCVGILPLTFMEMEGVRRSMHPTHSVFAWGALADELTSLHYIDNTPVGSNSPFMLLLKHKGKILFIGDILYSCTFMHGLEEIVNTPYVLNTEMTRYSLKDETGKISEKDYYTHNFKGWEQEYPRIRDILSYPDIRDGTVCSASCTLIDAAKLKTAAIERFNEDIYAFVSPAGLSECSEE
ncbi:MAG: AAC(3) family N-acetyltransferase [Oscillospiraceae bacterium]|nr:AAC(3) family N-acetyltransferase [Oscillospiraceae bacterium]